MCHITSLTPTELKKWLIQKLYICHKQIQCVQVPTDAELSIDEINYIINNELSQDGIIEILKNHKPIPLMTVIPILPILQKHKKNVNLIKIYQLNNHPNSKQNNR